VSKRRASKRAPKQDDNGCGALLAGLGLVLLWLFFFPFMVLAAICGNRRK
jgi:hypothetical protein